MYYDKRIRYLSYYESGIKLQNAGYVKFQVRDSLCQMIVYVKGPRLMGSGEARVYLLSEMPGKKRGESLYQESRKNDQEKHLLGTLAIRNGQGYCAVRLHAENMADSGLRYDEVCGIKIELHEYQYLESQWTVVNFMPGQRTHQNGGDADRIQRQDGGDAGHMQRREENNDDAARNRWDGKDGAAARSRWDGKDGAAPEDRYGSAPARGRYGSVLAGGRQSSMSEAEDDTPVEVSLIVTPVSEKSRVEKVAREIPVIDIDEMEEFEEEDDFIIVDGRGGNAEKAAAVPAEITENRTESAENQAVPAGRRKEKPVTEVAGAISEKPSGEEESMQEMLERKILGEEAEAVQPTQAGRSAETKRPEQPEQTLEEEILQGMEGGKRGGAPEAMEEIRPAEQELQPDKWEQLRKTYPVVHPIREEEEYLKIAPKDFVIFTEKYQELVHNSFLLHGYYNYKHLILGRREKDGEAVYYLGVPGTFHEREKTVAVMFGFEAFDGKREPAENGDFGYYLRRVEI